MTTICEVTHRHVTAVHYTEKGKYMIWYHIEAQPMKTIGIMQVRGLKEALTQEELKSHINKRWEEYYALKSKKHQNSSI